MTLKIQCSRSIGSVRLWVRVVIGRVSPRPRILQRVLPQRRARKVGWREARKFGVGLMIVPAFREENDGSHGVIHRIIKSTQRSAIERWLRRDHTVALAPERACQLPTVRRAPLTKLLERPSSGLLDMDPLLPRRDLLLLGFGKAAERNCRCELGHSGSLSDRSGPLVVLRAVLRTDWRAASRLFGCPEPASQAGSGISGRQDLNLRPLGPQPSALPDCATPRWALHSTNRREGG
jgi:hypothetical protein